jgi:hypothetical protein
MTPNLDVKTFILAAMAHLDVAYQQLSQTLIVPRRTKDDTR